MRCYDLEGLVDITLRGTTLLAFFASKRPIGNSLCARVGKRGKFSGDEGQLVDLLCENLELVSLLLPSYEHQLFVLLLLEQTSEFIVKLIGHKLS